MRKPSSREEVVEQPCNDLTLYKSSLSPMQKGVVRQTPSHYGVVIDSNEVHDEIRNLSSQTKKVIEKHFQKHATSEAQVLQGIQRFGPSSQSKKILNRENGAAILAFKIGVYVLWRCEQPKLSGSNTDFCARIGYQHRCFCGHTLEEHATPKPVRGRVSPPRCEACGCGGFNYIPNEPEEIGEGWLTRRRNWDPSAWSSKCRCGHGNKQHDPRTRSCNQCGCGMYVSHFLCVVCDCDGEAHTTVFELEHDRVRNGLPVREAFFPLGTLDWSVRELVLDDATGGGALTPPLHLSALKANTNMGRGLSDTPQKALPPLPVYNNPTATFPEIPQHCSACAAVLRTKSNFCSKCGKPRQQR